MKRAIRNSVIAVAVASGAMAVAGPAQADSTADGSAEGSPGLISGNGIQLPVDVPVNVCGNTLNVVGLLNPAMGNRCANEGGKARGGKSSEAPGGAAADGSAHGSPGVVSGNNVQLPIDLPVNLSGNSANLVGIGNPAFGNESVNGPVDRPNESEDRSVPSTPRVPHQSSHPAEAHSAAEGSPAAVQPEAAATLAHTGADNPWVPSVASLALLTAGAVLYRRSRPSAGSRRG